MIGSCKVPALRYLSLPASGHVPAILRLCEKGSARLARRDSTTPTINIDDKTRSTSASTAERGAFIGEPDVPRPASGVLK